ncbi:hypothetical protein O181_023815 [Austropuccinia psidii MF-1]|uniref:Uncharacterized protein n=1 Tax=Austropuccinia psidii MF-1 TaxID=1389203 RepID=A0A9Q3CJA6_9BASI|nr:hypothetical protein [Austropuccinia psidii MF-1]
MHSSLESEIWTLISYPCHNIFMPAKIVEPLQYQKLRIWLSEASFGRIFLPQYSQIIQYANVVDKSIIFMEAFNPSIDNNQAESSSAQIKCSVHQDLKTPSLFVFDHSSWSPEINQYQQTRFEDKRSH